MKYCFGLSHYLFFKGLKNPETLKITVFQRMARNHLVYVPFDLKMKDKPFFIT